MRWIVVLFISVFFSCLASAKHLAVVYPEQAAFKTIYTDVHKGLLDSYEGKIQYIQFTSESDVKKSITASGVDRVIALGRTGYNLARSLYKDMPVIVGAVPIKPNGISGVSLVTDPAILFDHLTDLAPNIKKVHVVYSNYSEWVMDFARERAKLYGVELNAVKVDKIPQAVRFYEAIIKENDKNTAIWLPLDPLTVNEKAIVPSLFAKAWKNRILIFSSKPTHAQKGALFSALPNNYNLGIKLGVMVDKLAKNKKKLGVKPLSEVEVAVNLRTATHLGYNFEKNETDMHFSRTFPQ